MNLVKLALTRAAIKRQRIQQVIARQQRVCPVCSAIKQEPAWPEYEQRIAEFLGRYPHIAESVNTFRANMGWPQLRVAHPSQ